jgi:hypothetical protein
VFGLPTARRSIPAPSGRVPAVVGIEAARPAAYSG